MPPQFLERQLDYIFFYGLAFLLLAAIWRYYRQVCRNEVFVSRQRIWEWAQQIAQSETQLANALQVARIGSWTHDLRTNTVAWSDQMHDICGGLTRIDNPTPTSLSQRLDPDERLKLEAATQALRESGMAYEIELCINRTDQTVCHVVAKAQARRADDGSVFQLVGTLQDVTERTRTERALVQSEEKLRLLLDSTGEAIYGVDVNGDCTFCNPACLRLLGYQRSEDLLGKNMHWLVHHTQADGRPLGAAECVIAAAYRKGKAIHLDSDILWRADGTSFPVEYWAHPQKVGDRVVGAVLTFVDITARKRFEKELKDAHAALEETNRDLQRANTVKRQFLATMSHEIRTPLNAIVGMTSMLLDTELDSEQKECGETILASGEVLLALINDILDFSKLEAERMELENQPFSLLQCVEEALALVNTRAAEKGIKTACQVEGELPWCYVGDAARLRQVLVNLLSNAVKFTDRGEVTVTLSSEEHNDDNYELHFAVRDTGLGVAPDMQNRLFQSFSQIDASTSRRFGGTGLGLAISKRLCELMDGRMWVESTGIPGEGSTFHFTAHAAKAADQNLSDQRNVVCTALEKPTKIWKEKTRSQTATGFGAVEPCRLRVLLAEDNPINQKVALKMLAKIGYRADVASNGIETLQAFQTNPYDAILMDCQMPEMDGYEATRQIRLCEQEQHRNPVHIIAMTANVMQGDRELCLEAGMDDYLGKPVRTSELQAILRRCQPVNPDASDMVKPDVTQPITVMPAAANASAVAPCNTEPNIMEHVEPSLDMELLDENGEIGIEGLQELLDMYLAQADEIFDALRTAIDAGESDHVNRLAHKLAGSSAVCGVTALVTPLRAIEMCGREGRLSDANSLFVQATEQLERCRRLLAEYMADKTSHPQGTRK